jgi:hypothetical protein
MTQFSPEVVQPKTLPNHDMIALAYAAYRVNGNQYIKDTRRFSEEKPTQFSNKDLMRMFLTQKGHAAHYVPNDYVPFKVTSDDYAAIERARNHFKRYTMDILGDSLNDFQKTVYEAFCADNIPVNSAGIVAYLPQLVEREMEDIAFKKLLRVDYRDSAHIGAVGDSVEGVVKILRKFYSEQWEKWNYTAALNGNIVSFMNAYEHDIDSMKRIKAKVKSHTKNRMFSVDETRLNYVKLYKV